MVPSLEHFAEQTNNQQANVLASALDKANAQFLEQDKSPTRRLGGIDNRGSHFYLALYWAKELSEQNEDVQLKETFTHLAEKLSASEEQIVNELIDVQGSAADIGGYYKVDESRCTEVMRPSKSLNALIG